MSNFISLKYQNMFLFKVKNGNRLRIHYNIDIQKFNIKFRYFNLKKLLAYSMTWYKIILPNGITFRLIFSNKVSFKYYTISIKFSFFPNDIQHYVIILRTKRNREQWNHRCLKYKKQSIVFVYRFQRSIIVSAWQQYLSSTILYTLQKITIPKQI